MSNWKLHKLWKALAVFAVLVLVVVLRIQIFLPGKICLPLFIGVLTYGISLFSSVQIPVYRRWGMAYLALTGITYLLVGLIGFPARGAGLLAANVWSLLISPGPFLAVIGGLTSPISFDIHKLDYWIWPDSKLDQALLSLFACLVGSLAIAAAFAMAKNKKIAYNVWFALVMLSILGAVGYVVAQFGKWGMPQYLGPDDPTQTVIALCLATSYAVAYIMARIGVDFEKRAVITKTRLTQT